MPVRLDARRKPRSREMEFAWRRAQVATSIPLERSQCISIALVNNMPQAAFRATERQFISLLNAASGQLPVFLSLHVLPGSEQREESGYSSVETLFDKRFDGLIVTGRESQKPNLKDEAYWDEFTSLVDWARENTGASIWSCLAAHAAVQHIDDVSRRRNAEKYSGIFDCACDPNHFLTAGAPRHFQVPHSRWHGLSGEELTGRGYRLLVRTAQAEPDIFVKEENSLLVFLQGHLEYEADTLLREYRRDVGRYLRNEAKSYPSMPRGCFDQATAEALSTLQQRVCSTRDRELLFVVAALLNEKPIKNTWHTNAALIYRNWLQYLWARKSDSQVDVRMSDPQAIQPASDGVLSEASALSPL